MAKDLALHDSFSITPSGIMQFLTMVIVAFIMATMVMDLSRSSLVTQYIQSQMYQGVTDPREHDCTDELFVLDLINNSPYTPWVSAQFINDGPDSVWVAINYPDNKFKVKVGQSATVNRIGAVERISYIYCVCDTGEEVSVTVIGEY